MRHLISKQTGFTLVETLVAISILMLAILGPLSIATAGLRNSAFARDQITAFYLAQEGIELVRYVRDDNRLRGSDTTNWLTDIDDCKIVNGNDHGCIMDIPTWFEGDGDITGNMVKKCTNDECENGDSRQMYMTEDGVFNYVNNGSSSISPYKRIVKIEGTDEGGFDKEVKITSTISWRTSGGDQKMFVLTEYLSNIYNQI